MPESHEKCKCFLTNKIHVILEADICEQQGLSRYKCYGRAKIKAFSPSTAEFCYLSCCFSVRESKHSVLLLLLWFILPQKFIFHEYKRSSCLCEQNVHRIVTLTPMPRIWTNFHHSLFCSHWSRVKWISVSFADSYVLWTSRTPKEGGVFYFVF